MFVSAHIQAENERVAKLPQYEFERDEMDALKSGWAGETSDDDDDEGDQ